MKQKLTLRRVLAGAVAALAAAAAVWLLCRWVGYDLQLRIGNEPVYEIANDDYTQIIDVPEDGLWQAVPLEAGQTLYGCRLRFSTHGELYRAGMVMVDLCDADGTILREAAGNYANIFDDNFTGFAFGTAYTAAQAETLCLHIYNVVEWEGPLGLWASTGTVGALSLTADGVDADATLALQYMTDDTGSWPSDLANGLAPLLDYFVFDFVPGFVNGLSLLLAPVVGDVVSTVITSGTAILSALANMLTDSINTWIIPALDLVKQIWLDLATAWNETWTTYISPIFTAFCEVVQDVCDIIQRLWTEVIDPILASLVTSLTELWNTHLSPLFSDLIAVGGDAINAIATVIKALWDNVIDPLANWLLSTFGPVFTQVFNSVAGIVTNAIGIVADVLDIGLICLQAVIDFMRNVFEGDWEAAWQVVQDAVSDIWDVISDRIRGAINNIIGFVNGMISAIVSGLNTVINGLNSLSFDAPSWVTDLTGISSFGFNIGTVTAPQIPYLAQGAVIPANREFLAVLGDQSHGTNVEAPLDTIKQAVAEVMEDLQAGQMAGFEAVVSVLREILSAVYGIELTDEDVGRAVQRWQRKQLTATGGV